MNNFNVLRSNSKGFGANLTDFHSGQLKTLDRLVDSKDSDETNLNPDDIVLDTIAPYENTIFSKQNLGPYKYTYHNDTLSYAANLPKPKSAVKQIESSTADLSKFRQKLTYTSFNSVKTIKDTIIRSMGTENPPDSVEITKTFYYGSDGQRVLMVSKEDDVIIAKKYYIGEYEYTDSVAAETTKEVTYISSPTGLVAANVKIDEDTDFYYVLTDHLGSITQLLTDQGLVITNAQFTYDAWGRLRDLTNTSNPYLPNTDQTANFHILDRGYCGHEHLLDHAIINMNGRIYDPVVGQFMQADNYIQTPEDYIGYNRYAYCRYNPFKYTDPSGEMWRASGYKEQGINPAARAMYYDDVEPTEPVPSPNAYEKVYDIVIWKNGKGTFKSGTAYELGGGGKSGGSGRAPSSGAAGGKSNDATGETGTGDVSGENGTNKDGTASAPASTRPSNFVETIKAVGGKQPGVNTCAFYNYYLISAANGTNIPYADFVSAYEDKFEHSTDPYPSICRWETEGVNSNILNDAVKGLGLNEDVYLFDFSSAKDYINRGYVIYGVLDNAGASIDHSITIYDYKDSGVFGTQYYYWDTGRNCTGYMDNFNGMVPLFMNQGKKVFGIGYQIP